MAEERTVSAFTWITPASRSLMSIWQMGARTIVQQHYTETKVIRLGIPSILLQKVNHFYFYSQARNHSTTRPTVKFYNVKEKIFSKKNSAEAEKLRDDEDDDGWLDEPAESFESATLLEAETSSFLDLNSKHLTTFLADTKDKASNNTVTTTGSQGPKKSSQSVNAPDDNDFSINFD